MLPTSPYPVSYLLGPLACTLECSLYLGELRLTVHVSTTTQKNHFLNRIVSLHHMNGSKLYNIPFFLALIFDTSLKVFDLLKPTVRNVNFQ